jgi:hypothetical protein
MLDPVGPERVEGPRNRAGSSAFASKGRRPESGGSGHVERFSKPLGRGRRLVVGEPETRDAPADGLGRRTRLSVRPAPPRRLRKGSD